MEDKQILVYNGKTYTNEGVNGWYYNGEKVNIEKSRRLVYSWNLTCINHNGR